MSALFQPIQIRGLALENRIMVSPMCQYSAVDGSMTDWHYTHLGMLSNSGAALLCFEMTDVEPIGRITPGCSGLYSDANEAALRRVAGFCRAHGQAKLAIQIAHAGRKASTAPPWENRKPLRPEEGGWQPVAPSAIAMDEDSPTPRALTREEIKTLVAKFADSAQRAERIGFDAIELHGAHGYLIHEFLSPIANRREDEYGGSLANRMRFPLQVARAVRAAEAAGVDLAGLPLRTLQRYSPKIGKDVFKVLTLEGSVAARDHAGGTAPAQVRAAIGRARAARASARKRATTFLVPSSWPRPAKEQAIGNGNRQQGTGNEDPALVFIPVPNSLLPLLIACSSVVAPSAYLSASNGRPSPSGTERP